MESHGKGGGRSYTLSASVYRELDQKSEYVRQAGFDEIQREEMILRYVREHGKITRRETAELCRISVPQAYHFLKKIVDDGKLEGVGAGRAAAYILPADSGYDSHADQ